MRRAGARPAEETGNWARRSRSGWAAARWCSSGAGSATSGPAASGTRRRWSPSSPAPRASSGHGHVFGFLVGEVVRRITGLTPGRFFREAIGEPLGLRAWIGLPAAERGQLARLVEAEGRPAGDPQSLLMRMVTMNGALVFPGLDEPHGFNDPELLGTEIGRAHV